MYANFVYLACRQLQDLILVKQQALDECKTLKKNAEASDQRIFELEERNLKLENELSKSYKNLAILQGISVSACNPLPSIPLHYREVRIYYKTI